MTHTSSTETVSVRGLSQAMGKERPTAASSAGVAACPFPLRAGAALPREILAWLQSLQLSSSVKYPKRDLANGYVIAHICARYWPHVPLHSFENKTGTANKQSNWFVLRKVFLQRGVEVSPTMVDGMMNGADDCASAFLQQLYTLLTGRHVDVQAVPLKNPPPDVPASKVPAFVPTSNGSAAARRRCGDGARDSRPLMAMDSSKVFSGTHEKSTLFGATDSCGSVLDDRGKDNRANLSIQLPALAIPKKSPAGPIYVPKSREVASSMPVLSVTVRSADQVSTVLPTQRAPPSAATDADDAPPRAEGSSLAGAWFCMKVRESVPADALEALTGSDQAAAAPTPSLLSTLRWLSDTPSGEGGGENENKAHLEDSQDNYQALLRMHVWQAIFDATPELGQILVQSGGHGLDILVDCLFASVKAAQLRLGSDERRGTGGGVCFYFVRNAVHFCTLLLETLSDLNVHHALTCFETYLAASPTFAQALRGVQWPLAAKYAELITSLLPTTRGEASQMLKALWVSIECIVRDSAAEECMLRCEAAAGDGGSGAANAEQTAEVCLLVLLRALLTSLLAIEVNASPHRRSAKARGSHAQIDASGRTAPGSACRTAPRSLKGTAETPLASQDAVRSTIVQLAAQHSTMALQRAVMNRTSAAEEEVDVAAVALAVQLLCIDLHPSLVAEHVIGVNFFDVYNSLFPFSSSDAASPAATTLSPTLSVLRARWLRYCLQRRFELGLSCHSPATSAAATIASSHTAQHPQSTSRTVVSLEALDGGDRFGTTSTPAPAQRVWLESHEMRALLAGVQTLCHDLSAVADSSQPAEVESRVLVACALAESLPFLPARYRTESASAAHAWIFAVGRQHRSASPVTATTSSSPDSVDGEPSSETQTTRHSSLGDGVFAEDAAEAVLRVLVHEATPAQISSIITSPSESHADAAAQGGEGSEGEARWIVHRYVGPLKPSGWLVEQSDPLLLVKAALAAVDNSTDLHSSVPAATERDMRSAGAVRRLGARTAMLAREGQVEERVSERVLWLARILVEGRARGSGAATLLPRRGNGDGGAGRRPLSSAREDTVTLTSEVPDAMVLQWKAVVSSCYEDLVVIAQAASLRLRQRGGFGTGGGSLTGLGGTGSGDSKGTAAAAAMAQLSEAIGHELAILAQKAEGVVCCLWRELAPVLVSSSLSGSRGEAAPSAASSSVILTGSLFSFLEDVSQEELATAVSWIVAVGTA
ncbi:hypothetical protein JKF63_07662 [Porcisia hertigi]|uniref:CH-like domain-containing protein n=1 Tax=Porcisia hertigi TaxID=2761500 RepID=A0A836IV34_9TRYP|nr:hypothetical protein JKF63_07662 [Porcisia hertigi]